jgi:hypothetical protein
MGDGLFDPLKAESIGLGSVEHAEDSVAKFDKNSMDRSNGGGLPGQTKLRKCEQPHSGILPSVANVPKLRSPKDEVK